MAAKLGVLVIRVRNTISFEAKISLFSAVICEMFEYNKLKYFLQEILCASTQC